MSATSSTQYAEPYRDEVRKTGTVDTGMTIGVGAGITGLLVAGVVFALVLALA